MAIRITLVPTRETGSLEPKTMNASVRERESTLEALFDTLAKRHPDLAPLLEDATHADDLEIFVNNRPVPHDTADGYRLRDGDSVSLLLK